MQKPLGPKDENCPLWRKAMVKVCHKCPWWVMVLGNDPQTGAQISEWNCAITWGPTLAINIANQVREGAAATESFRNEVVKHQDSQVAAGAHLLANLSAIARESVQPRQLVEAPAPKMIEG